mmetsp:Transcript_61106/g.157570  ORF Transcript_61106/g.157570 Transcript_61106/m.157570 type:complete len:936 (+) Transcript_61106:1023-3830(+)
MARVQRHVVDRAHDEARLVGELREVADREAQGRLVDVQVQLEHRREVGGVDDADAGAPLPLAGLEGTHLCIRQVLLVVLLLRLLEVVVDGPREADLLQRRADLALRLLVVGVVVRLQQGEHDRVSCAVAGRRQHGGRQRHEAARRVGERHGRLVEELAEALARDDPERVAGDGHEALRALLGGEGGGVLELLVAHGRAVVLALEVVAHPRLAAERQHRRQALDRDLVQPHGARAEEARALVAERACDEVHHRADEDAAAEADAEEEAVHVLALAHVLHLQEADALGGRLQRLGAELLQRPLALQGQDADRVVHTSDRHEGRALPVLGHRLHGEAQDLVVHVTLGHLVERVALVDLEVQDLAAGQGDHDLALVGRGGDDTLLTRHTPLVRSARQQVPDAGGVHLDVGVVRHELDQQRGRRGQEATVQHLLDRVADGEHERDVDEGHDDVAVELAVHRRLHGPHGVRLTGQLAHRHLGHGQAVAQHAHRGPRPAAAERVQLGLALARGVQHLHVHDRRERRHLVVEHEVLQRARLEGDQRLGAVGVRGGAHGVLLVRANALELVERVVAELRGGEEEAGLQHAERVRERDSVEVLDLHLRHEVLVVRERDLVEVAVLTLDEEEEEVLQLVRRVRDDEQTLLLGHLETSRDGAHDVGVSLLLVHQAVLAADQSSAGAIHTAGHSDERVGAVVHGVRELARHVVQAQVHLVEGEHLLRGVRVRVAVHLFVAQLDGREERVLEADVHAHHGVHDRVALVRLQRRGDREPGRGVAVQDVHELLLLDRADHHRAALRVHGEVLSRHDAAAARLPVGLLVHLLEDVLLAIILEDDDAPRVGGHHDVVAAGACEPEGLHGADHAEDLLRQNALHLPGVVRPQQLQRLVARDDDLLRLRGGEVAVDRVRDGRGPLQGQLVELGHGRGSLKVLCGALAPRLLTTPA